MNHRVERPSILEAIPIGRHAAVEASAGTGKTFLIEHLVLDRIIRGAATIDQILVVTFTEKATSELRRRIRDLLEKSAQAPATPLDENVPAWTIGQAELRRISAALASFDRADISTIHGFCRRILAETAFVGGRMLAPETQKVSVSMHRVVRDVLRNHAADPDIAAVIESRTTADDLEKLPGFLTRLFPHRDRAEPEVTIARFRAALAEFRAAVADRKTIDAFDAAAKSALHARTFAAVKKRVDPLITTLPKGDSSREILAYFDDVRDAADGMKKLFEPGALSDRQPPRLFSAIAAMIDASSSDAALLASSFAPLVFSELEKKKFEEGFFDFDDLIRGVESAVNHPDADDLRKSLAARWRLAIIDEFQDTDELQWRIFRRIFLDRTGERALVVVGDPKQSIYGFRSADIATYLAARREIKETGGVAVELKENFRSSGRLIAALNRVFTEGAAGFPFFTGALASPSRVGVGKKDLELVGPSIDAPIEVLTIAPPENLKLSKAKILDIWAAHIAERTRKLLGDPGVLLREKGRERRLVARDIFVLVRTASDGKKMTETLRRFGVQAALYREGGLFGTSEAMDVRDLLRAIIDPYDRPNRLRAFLTPFFGASPEDLAAASAAADDHPFVDRLTFWNEMARRRAFDRLFASVLDDSGLLRRLIVLAPDERSMTNYEQIFELLRAELLRTSGDLLMLLETLEHWIAAPEAWLDDDDSLLRIDSDEDAVQVMTMHKSKGLEAAAVFLFGGIGARRSNPDDVHRFYADDRRRVFVGTIPPSRQEIESAVQKNLDEESQRLFYVALTRAKMLLSVAYFAPRDTDKGKKYPTPLGEYECVNRRLEDILVAGANDPAIKTEFRFVDTECHAPEAPQMRSAGTPATGRGISSLDLFADESSTRTLLDRHPPEYLTSYTAIKKSGDKTDAKAVSPRGDFLREDAAERGALARGAETGIFLHAILERIDLADVQAWTEASRPPAAIDEIFADESARRGIGEDALKEARRLVHSVLAEPLVPKERVDPPLPPLAAISDFRREIEFRMTAPRAAADHAAAPGFITGFIDFVFVHDQKIWFGDWKSDTVPDDVPLADWVLDRYRIQIEIYTVAIARWAKITDAAEWQKKFGGILYVFLRRAEKVGGAAGTYFFRPSFDDVAEFEKSVASRLRDGRTT